VVQIIKASGEKEEFDKRHIESSLMRAGASSKIARDIANQVAKSVKPNMKTGDILNLALKLLKSQPVIATKYNLKRAIMNLGPHGFLFEEYLAQILQKYGYKTQTDVILKGQVVTHEVDVIAEKGKVAMIEAKYHNSPGTHTDTKVALYTHARFLDLKSNPKNKLDESWLVTNTKCTHRATAYSKGVGQKIIGWSYPKKGNLQELIEAKSLYPITIYIDVSDAVKDKLLKAKLVLASDLQKFSVDELKTKTGLNEKVLSDLLEKTKNLCKNC
jgi:hypothetical protein